MNGGYVLINAAGVSLAAESETTVNGLFNELYRAMSLNKPIVLYNVLTGSDEALYTPIGCACTLGEVITVHTYVGISFTVTSADVVEIVTEVVEGD